MNTGQMLFAIGALTLLSFIILRVNSNILYADVALQNSKDGILANSVGVSIMEKATKKFFDEKTITGPVPKDSLTSITKLGRDPGETNLDSFDDFDDFNNYTEQDTFYGSIVFYSSCRVCYVNPTTPDVAAGSKTWNKKLSISTYARYINGNSEPTDTFKLSTIYSYWFFE